MIAGTAVLVVASTLVAFHGWPGVAAVADHPDATMLTAVQASSPARATRQAAAPTVSMVAARPAVAVRHVAVHAQGHGLRARTVSLPSRSGSGSPSQRDPSIQSAGGGAPAPAASPASPAAASAQPATKTATDGVRQAGQKVGGAVDQVTQHVSSTVAPVSPPVAQTVDNAGKAVDSTVQGATNSVAGAVDGLVKPKP